MSSGRAPRSSSSLSGTISTLPTQTSLKSGAQQVTSSYSPKSESSHRSCTSVSTSFNSGSNAKRDPHFTPASLSLKPSSLPSIKEKICSASPVVPSAKQMKTNKPRKGCIGGLEFDFRYHNLVTASGQGRSTVGSGSGVPGGCDIM